MDGLVLVAGGRGERLQSSTIKALASLAGEPMFLHALKPFLALGFKDITVVVPHGYELEFRCFVPEFVKIIPGGATRQESVYQGLMHCESQNVLIHDAARPFITKDLIQTLSQSLFHDKAVVPKIPVVDTLRQILASSFIDIDRNSVFAMQTPQGFCLSRILIAHEKALVEGFTGTDDLAIYANAFPDRICFIEGDVRNFKITTQRDLDYATWLLMKEESL